MKRRHAATMQHAAPAAQRLEQSDDASIGIATDSSEIPAPASEPTPSTFSDLGDFDLAGMAARVAASFAQSLHGNSLVYSSRATSSAGTHRTNTPSSSSSAPSWTPPAPADHASAGGRVDPHRRLALVQRHDGVFRLPAAVVAARAAEHRPVTEAPGFLNAATAPLVAGNPKAVKRAAAMAAAAAAPPGVGAAKEVCDSVCWIRAPDGCFIFCVCMLSCCHHIYLLSLPGIDS
jgi:hypothetical protein